jgi:DNA-binding NtrC family response regulator
VSVENRADSIVDDDPDIVMLFHEALKSMSGITIFTFTDPILALEHFQVNEYAYVLVISDFKMPGLNGMEFLKKIKELNRFVRTILMTAFQIEDKVFREYTKKKIINAFLQKPIGIHDLLKVDTQLHSYEMQKNFLHDSRNHIKYLLLWSDTDLNNRI